MSDQPPIMNETHQITQRDAAFDEPEEHDDAGHAEDENPCEKILARPPERKQEEDGENDAGDLARVRIEAARDEGGADETRAEVPRGEREPRDPARHARRAALVRCTASAPHEVHQQAGYSRSSSIE